MSKRGCCFTYLFSAGGADSLECQCVVQPRLTDLSSEGEAGRPVEGPAKRGSRAQIKSYVICESTCNITVDHIQHHIQFNIVQHHMTGNFTDISGADKHSISNDCFVDRSILHWEREALCPASIL